VVPLVLVVLVVRQEPQVIFRLVLELVLALVVLAEPVEQLLLVE
jgi:hypothetical protein